MRPPETPAPSGLEDDYLDPDLYDLTYSTYADDIPYYVEAARRARGPVLEAACGTGRVLLPIREQGIDISGFDRSTAMVERLRAKAAARGLTLDARVADFRTFTWEHPFALITIPFRAFMHLLTTDDQIQALSRMREHLIEDGELRFNLFYPSFTKMAEWDGQRILEREVADPGSGNVFEIWAEPRYNRVRQALVAVQELVPKDGGAVRRRGFTLRWSYRFEIELLLRAAGFTRWEVNGGFDGRPLARDTDEMVWTAIR